MSACINAPGTSTIATSRFSSASISAVRKTASVDTVGEVASSLVVHALCLLPSAQPRPLTFPHRFRFRNMRYPSASRRCFQVKSLLCFDFITFLSCSCCSSSATALTPCSPNILIPRFMDICGVASGAASSVSSLSSLSSSSFLSTRSGTSYPTPSSSSSTVSTCTSSKLMCKCE